MVSIASKGINPIVQSRLDTPVSLSKQDNGRTFMTAGTNKNSVIEFDLPATLMEGFRVRIGVNGAGVPATIDAGKNSKIAMPRKSSLLTGGNEGTRYLTSYDPGAFLDLVWDPGAVGESPDKWRIVSGAGLWVARMTADDFHLDDLPAEYKVDFGKPSATSSSWDCVYGATQASTSTFQVVSTQANYDLLRPGMPIRWIEGTVDLGWRYGVIETFEASGAAPTQAVVRFSGVPMNTNPIALEVGPREAVRRISLSFPGNFDPADETDMIRDLNKTFVTWSEGDAALVRVSTICLVADTGTAPPEINVTIGGNAVVSTAISTTDTIAYSGVDIDPATYLVAFGDALEVTNHNTPANGTVTNGDAEDLTVELIFVQDKRIAFWDHDEAVKGVLNMVISGLGGGTWAGLADGVHAVIPTTHTRTAWTMSTSLGNLVQSEVWEFVGSGTASTQYLKIGANAHRAPATTGTGWGTTVATSRFTLARNSSMSTKTSITGVAGGSGYIRNGMMRSVTVDGITFTWWKLGTNWGSAFI